MKFAAGLKFFEKWASGVNHKKDVLLRPLIKRCWPRQITPNAITYARLALTPLIIFMCFDYGTWRYLVATLTIIFFVSDMLDGIVARTFKIITGRGALLDPMADKLLTIPLFICLLYDNKPLFYSLIASETTLLVLGLLFKFVRKDVSANIWGKVKLLSQAIGLSGLMIFGDNIVSIAILWASVMFGIGSIAGRLRR